MRSWKIGVVVAIGSVGAAEPLLAYRRPCSVNTWTVCRRTTGAWISTHPRTERRRRMGRAGTST